MASTVGRAASGERPQDRTPGVPPSRPEPDPCGPDQPLPPARQQQRPDASMTLLREVMEHPLDPGYAAAARAPREPGATGAGRRRTVAALAVPLAVAALCGWATTRSVAELRRPRPEVLQARAGLQEEIRRRGEAVEDRQLANRALAERISRAQARALATDGGTALAERGAELGAATGQLAVAGPGLEVSLADRPRGEDPVPSGDPRDATDDDQGRVRDRDLQIVVNGLWAAGAEAVSVNGRRLTSLSAIRAAGLAILVDYRPLTPPYVVQAIGDPGTLQARFAADKAGSYLQLLRDNYGVRASTTPREELRLPAAPTVVLRSATAAPTGAPATGGTPGESGSPTTSGSPGTTRSRTTTPRETP